ncbi:hypothetical protein [Streptomyces sp. HM190]|uniref:hypothetical protein n=1 Tax=Streptomyces sp. HM190 TaxID=2695266 RepID=UPI00135853D7|nr:hypothetical protein [Streptomyces sp. HM190]
MNGRVLRMELRRSVAPWAGAVILVTTLGFLYLLSGPWWKGSALWTAQWTSMALWTRTLLLFLWPLAVALGALQGLRDHRSKVSELLASTPRPIRHRAAVTAGALSLTLALAYGLLVLQGAGQVLAHAWYHHAGWLPISLVGGFSLIAGAVLGMGIGRALPSPLTPPALAVAAFLFTAFVRQWSDSAVPSSNLPNRLTLLSPSVADVREVLLTLSGRVHAGQTAWLLGMAATGFALLLAATPRTRLLALAPVVAGAAIALLVLPSDPRRTYVVDRAAAAQVCDGPVCVARVHEARLAGLAGPGRKALGLLHDALGDRAPTTVRETTAPRGLLEQPERSRTTVFVDFDDDALARATGEELTRALVGQGIAPTCFARSQQESGTLGEIAAQSVVAGWALGTLEPIRGTVHSPAEQLGTARPVFQELEGLRWSEQVARIRAAHAEAMSCGGDVLTVLDGGASG